MQLYCKEVTKISLLILVFLTRGMVSHEEQEMLIFRFYPKEGPFFSRWEDNEKNFSIFGRKWFSVKKSEKKVKNGPFFEKWLFSSILGFNFHLELFFKFFILKKKVLTSFFSPWRMKITICICAKYNDFYENRCILVQNTKFYAI